MNLYRIYYGDNNDKTELGRVTAPDMDKAIKYALGQYFKPELQYQEDGDIDHALLIIDSCEYCDKTEIMEINEIQDEDELCENCEVSEYIEIILDNEAEAEFKTIFGVNEYANTETDIKPVEYNSTLVKAWKAGPQIGVTELMHQTINNNPDMVEAIDPAYLRAINKNHSEVTKLTLEANR